MTFLFTDVEGSTRRWEADADVMRKALAAHDEVLRSAIKTMAHHKPGFAQVTRQRSGRYSVRYTTPAGTRVSAGKTFARKADAEAWAADRHRQIDRGHVESDGRRITFGAYAVGWLADRHVAGRPIKPRTRAHYQSILDGYLLPAFGARRLSAITPADVRDWHAAALPGRPTMRAHAYGLLRTILGSAVNDDLLGANPCRIVGAGRATGVHKVKNRRLTAVGSIWALASLRSSPGARRDFDARRASGDWNRQAQRHLFNKFLGQLHHCL